MTTYDRFDLEDNVMLYNAFTNKKRYNNVLVAKDNTCDYFLKLLNQIYEDIYSTSISEECLDYIKKYLIAIKHFKFQEDIITLTRALLLKSFTSLENENVAKALMELFFRSLPPRVFSNGCDMNIIKKYDSFSPLVPDEWLSDRDPSMTPKEKIIPCPRSATAMNMMTEGHLAHTMRDYKLQVETPAQCALRLANTTCNVMPEQFPEMTEHVFKKFFNCEIVP